GLRRGRAEAVEAGLLGGLHPCPGLCVAGLCFPSPCFRSPDGLALEAPRGRRFGRVHSGHRDEPAERERLHPVLGLAAPEGEQCGPEADHVMADLDSAALGRGEVAELTQADGDRDADEEEDEPEDVEQDRQPRPPFGTRAACCPDRLFSASDRSAALFCSATKSRANSRAQASAARTVSTVCSAAGSWAAR